MLKMVHEDGAAYGSDVFYYESELLREMEYRVVFSCYKDATAGDRLDWVEKAWDQKKQ